MRARREGSYAPAAFPIRCACVELASDGGVVGCSVVTAETGETMTEPANRTAGLADGAGAALQVAVRIARAGRAMSRVRDEYVKRPPARADTHALHATAPVFFQVRCESRIQSGVAKQTREGMTGQDRTSRCFCRCGRGVEGGGIELAARNARLY
jgi:hypothetical protein